MSNLTSKGLRAIPGVGRAVQSDLQHLGIREIDDLRGRDAEDLYRQLQELQGSGIDRCMLYVFRCAVYYAEGGRDPELVKWWNWKERPTGKSRIRGEESQP